MSAVARQSADPLGLALLVATALHALLILGVGFEIDRSSPPAPERTLDITLVQPKQEPEKLKPKEPDFLAQSTQHGGAERKAPERPTAPPSPPALKKAPRLPTREVPKAGTPKPAPKKVRRVVTTRKPEPVPKKPEVVSQPTTPPVKAPTRPDVAALLRSTQTEIDRLTAELDVQTRTSSMSERRKPINASTQEYKYAAYLEAWRRKVEKIGNLNYPDEARRRKLYGALILHVAVKADGTIEKIDVRTSSGHKILDDAAVRIVRLSAPFAPFPPNIHEEVDVLDITRTWQFLGGDQLSTGN